MKKQRLLIATDTFLPRKDGVSRFLQGLLPLLTQHFEVTLVCPHHQHIPPFQDVTIKTIKNTSFKINDMFIPYFSYFTIRKLVKQSDIVFTQTLGPIGASALLSGRYARKKVVSFVHSLDWELAKRSLSTSWFRKPFYFFAKWFAKFCYSRSSHLIVPSESIGDIFTWKKIYTPRSIVHLGVQTSKFQPSSSEKVRELKQRLGISLADTVIGYHGRISPEKDLPTLVRAFITLRKKYPHVKLLLLGSGVASLEKQLKKHKGVILHPAVSHVQDFLSCMDMYVLPSLTETTSLSVLEAMAMGLPVVSTPVGFVKDYIRSGKNGLFMKPSQSRSLVYQLEKYLKDDSFRKQVGAQARKTVNERFDWDRSAKELVEVLLNFEKKNH